MTQTYETRREGIAAEPLSLSCGEADLPTIARNHLATQAQFAAVQRLRRQRLVAHLHQLGPSPLFHSLNEVERGALPEHLERYARLDPDFIRTLGGTDFVQPLHVLDGGSR